MSYRKSHIKNKIHGAKARKSILNKPWFWAVFLVLALIFFCLYFVFFYSGFQVQNIIILGNNKVSTQDIKEIVSESSKSIFLINTGAINKDILKKFPAIEKLTISKNLPQTLVLDVVERKPLGVFCSNENQCFLIDNNGIIFEPLSSVPADAIIMRQIIENGQVFTGEEIIAENIINAISKIQKNLKDNFQIDLKEVLITSPLRINVKTNEDWQIYFDSSPDSDINAQITKLNMLLNDEISATQRKIIRYIDLRPKDRAIICDNKTCEG